MAQENNRVLSASGALLSRRHRKSQGLRMRFGLPFKLKAGLAN
jgi:hypothetical protein